MQTVTRFAPSPTGLLHVGNVRVALINWLFARAANGKFILRIDDTDAERSKLHYVEAIKRDLEWLGLEWDAIFFQSERFERYAKMQQKLIADGRLYPCYETQEELEVKKKNLLSRNLPPIYDRASLKLSTSQRGELESKGIRPHWRFLLADQDICWHDGVKGEMRFIASKLNDPVLIRADGSMTYTLASVVDDIDFGITDIIRGEDHVSNSAVHIQIFEGLGAAAPRLAHLSLLGSKTQEISKRLGGFDIGALKDLGLEPMAINSFLSKIGTADAIKPYFHLGELIAEFDIHKFGKAPANYDQVELQKFNARFIHNMPYEVAKDSLVQLGLEAVEQEFWSIARGNINTLRELEIWLKICQGCLEPSDIDYSLPKLTASLLPLEPWDTDTWSAWIAKVKDIIGKTGKDLFKSLRVALTGQEQGPKLRVLLPLIGRQKALKRLNGQAA
jgi:glutamyl-tRNA synthetase